MAKDDPTAVFALDSLLGQLSPGARAALAARWRIETYPPQHLIIGAKDPGRDIYFVLAGSVRAEAFTLSGREVSFNIIHAGDCIGEIAAIDGGVRSSNVVSMDEVTLARLSSTEFQMIMDTTPEVMRAFLHLVCGKVRTISDKLLSYTELTTPQRVRQELLTLARVARSGGAVQGDSALITEMPTQEEIGKRILARREAVAREMAKLKRRGLVAKRADGYFVPSLRKLEASVLL